MPTTLRAQNFSPINIKENTYVDADAAVGATSVTAKSAQNIAQNDFIYIGGPNSEGTEKRQVGAVSGQTLPVSALTFAHKRYEQIMAVNGDQIKFYRAANVDGSIPAAASFSAVSGGTVDIDADQLFTDFTDTGGSSSYWYTYTYRNSTTTNETELDPQVAVRGDDYNHYTAIDAIRKEAGFQNNTFITDGLISLHRDAAESEINGILIANYSLPLDQPVPAMVEYMARRLAAGMLLAAESLTKEDKEKGEGMMTSVRDMLTKIGNRTMSLVDYQGNSMLTAGNAMGGWPDNTTEEALPEDGGSERMFRISDRY